MKAENFIRQIYHILKGNSVLENVFDSNYPKNCLILYIKRPFLQKVEDATHQNLWQAKEIARIINALGYNVDVMDYYDNIVLLRKKYDAVFDICVKDSPVYKHSLKKDAKKIVYFTGSESVFANKAELKRLHDVFTRRGIVLQPRRQAPLISKNVESFDEAIIIGNNFSLETYKSFCLPKTFKVHNTGYNLKYDFDFQKKKSTNFLFLGSAGCVHKGLDLLLEIFSEKNFPCNLYVCGGIENERDFCKAYEKELYNTDNIKLVGFVDVLGKIFQELYDKCAYALLPSCSEGMAGSVVTCMSAGIIPICSKECGFENDEVITLADCNLETIRETVLNASQKDIHWIEQESSRMVALSQTKFSREIFTQEMRAALQNVLYY